MTATLPTPAKLNPNPPWARLPLFNGNNWLRFNGNVKCEAAA